MVPLDSLHFLTRTKHQRYALVQETWHPVEYSLATGRGIAAGLLDQQSNRVCFVKKTQPAIAVTRPSVARIDVDAAAHQDAMCLSDHRGDPTHVEVLGSRSFGAGETIVEPGADRSIPMAIVGSVDRKFARLRRNADMGGGKNKTSTLSIERENIGAGTERERKRGVRPVDDIAGGDLFVPWAQKRRGVLRGTVGSAAKQREDGADRYVGPDIGRSIKWIEG